MHETLNWKETRSRRPSHPEISMGLPTPSKQILVGSENQLVEKDKITSKPPNLWVSTLVFGRCNVFWKCFCETNVGPGLNGKSINKQVSTSRPRVDSIYSTLPETNSSPRKIKSWKIYFLLGWRIFRCCVSFRGCNLPSSVDSVRG